MSKSKKNGHGKEVKMYNKSKRAAFHNLGCKVNQYETDAMAQALCERGYEIVLFEAQADVYIINTCTVTNIADRKSRQMLHRARKRNPDAIVVAVGCYAQEAKEELLADEAVDIIIGNNKKSQLPDILEKYFEEYKEKASKIAVCEDMSKGCQYEKMQMTEVTGHTRAFIKIQDGCNQFCTYCIIPYSRGRIRSREISDIEREVAALSKKGYKEIVLTGIHLSSYGKDLCEENTTLIDVIEKLSGIDGIERIRLGSLEQGIITEEFMERVRKIKKFCPHFHLSLQSGCAGTLKRMNRHYTPSEYMEKCRLIRKSFDNPAITTDVITGFPGESMEEFKETKRFLEAAEFAEMHIFKYSRRRGTKAAEMENQVDERIKSERSDELLRLNNVLREKYIKKFMGKTADILFEEKILIENESYFVGYTREYVRVAVKTDKDLRNKIVCVKIKSLLNKEILLAQMNEIY